MAKKPEGYTGRLHEAEVLGRGVAQSKWFKRAIELGMPPGGGYLGYEKSLQLAREIQSGDPTNPEKGIGNDLRLAIIDRLEERGILEPGDEDAVKFYSAVGMPLDNIHGVDAFVEVTDPKTRSVRRVTLDETVKDEKLAEGYKADIVFAPVPDAVQEQDEYLAEIDRLADETVKILLENDRRAAA